LRESSGEFKRDQGCVLGVDTPTIPFWHLLFKNIRLDFLGSDDFPPEEKTKAALAILPGRNRTARFGCSRTDGAAARVGS
jgi:hypothetical protein